MHSRANRTERRGHHLTGALVGLLLLLTAGVAAGGAADLGEQIIRSVDDFEQIDDGSVDAGPLSGDDLARLGDDLVGADLTDDERDALRRGSALLRVYFQPTGTTRLSIVAIRVPEAALASDVFLGARFEVGASDETDRLFPDRDGPAGRLRYGRSTVAGEEEWTTVAFHAENTIVFYTAVGPTASKDLLERFVDAQSEALPLTDPPPLGGDDDTSAAYDLGYLVGSVVAVGLIGGAIAYPFVRRSRRKREQQAALHTSPGPPPPWGPPPPGRIPPPPPPPPPGYDDPGAPWPPGPTTDDGGWPMPR